MKKIAFALALTAAAASAMAQSGASLTSVEGLVTVTTGSQLVNATPNMPLAPNSRVLTTANGKATIKFPSGCVANLSGGQSMTVSEAACQQFVAAAGGAGAGGGAGSGIGGFVANNSLLLGGASVGLLAYNVDRNRSGGGTPPATTPPVVVTPTPPVAADPPARTPVRRPISRS
jgi:hypothetical protein